MKKIILSSLLLVGLITRGLFAGFIPGGSGNNNGGVPYNPSGYARIVLKSTDAAHYMVITSTGLSQDGISMLGGISGTVLLGSTTANMLNGLVKSTGTQGGGSGGNPGDLSSCDVYLPCMENTGVPIDSKGLLTMNFTGSTVWISTKNIYIPAGSQVIATSGLTESGDWSFYQDVTITGMYYYSNLGSPRQFEPGMTPSGSNYRIDSGSATLVLSTEYKIVYVYHLATTSFDIYVNGVLYQVGLNYGAFAFSNGAVEFGRPYPTFIGYVQDVNLHEMAIFHSALTVDEINSYNMGKRND